ncbi:MAG: hypothetical protein V7K97_24595 [Nostoc sp.]|uniref:hypothetical protein n=1 Tax=Nostoc sp. TaxID=1180 RepID=UPI002FFCAF22
MTQKTSSEKLVSGLLQSIEPKEIADSGVRQTVELLLNLIKVKYYAQMAIERFESGVESVKELLSTLTSDERWGVMLEFDVSPPHGNYKGMSYGQLSVLLKYKRSTPGT